MRELHRYMGIDHGTKRIGIALSDPFGLFASPHCVITHSNDKSDFDTIQTIINAEHVKEIVVGLPTTSDDGVGQQAIVVIQWARKLAQSVGVLIIMWNESYSTRNAIQIKGQRKQKRTVDPLDNVAAAVILQDYLDARETYGDKAGQPLETFTDIP